ncbi:MAG: hypothetical protein PUK81_09545 [Firmicutes bacterium]|nr:hypothetical protein [Bacillota bacterium]
MKQRKWKLLAMLLVVTMLVGMMVPTAAAAGAVSTGVEDVFSTIRDWVASIRSGINWPTLPWSGNKELTLVENQSTVSEGTALRASTYTLSSASGMNASEDGALKFSNVTPLAATQSTLKYFPVTMYNYDKTTINNATHQVEVDNGLGNTWNGIYFNDGNPSAESYTYSTGGEGSYTYSWTIRYDGGTANPSNRSITLYKASTGSTATTASLSYAAWNFWNKTGATNNSGTTLDNGQMTYSGLVASTLDANKNITFTKPDGGIFNSDATVKTIYTNVEMPFVYENGTYTFDASVNGAYFYEDSSQGSTTAQSNGRLYFAEGNTQGWSGMNYGDGSKNLWAPFNLDNLTGEDSVDYHFGMAATIPFTMTANGRMNPNDDNSEAITFSFSGDDDVWIFIDGQLVIDLGGIHNRLDATINFAENTWSLSSSNSKSTMTADINGATISGALFNDGDTTGTLNQTRETFAAKDTHELTIFYLERGAGSSNCKIQFNLPMKDVVSVTKRATQSIANDGTVSPLTAKEQATVDNIDFGFTLTKNGDPVANTNYSLLNANGQVIGTPSTDVNGRFSLRNGQTAKFVGEIVADGAVYQVVEDAVDGIGFTLPTYTYSGTAAGGYTVSGTSYSEGSAIPATEKSLASAAITAKGSTEAVDSLQFICENYFDANLPNPSSRPVDDQIVIDYGLPVVIDVLANDVYRGDTIELTDVTDAQYGTATIENGKITYQLTKQLTGVEVLTYTAKVTGSGNEGTETITASESKTAKVYIIPATAIYYEEDFSDLVTFTNGTKDGATVATWSNVGTAQTDPQEPGVVGTVGDSPYGSDAAYLNDGGDSNGSSKYVNTTNGSASFSYTFTGTGTSFFARTTSNSGYMRVVITDEDDKPVNTGYRYRDTSYKNAEGTIGGDTNVTGGVLYNIPVFTYEADNYGTYTVTVTIAGGFNAMNYGKEFWLDGIRVIQPLDSTDANYAIAGSAYATDGEANMTVATLRDKLIGEAQINEDGTISWNGGNFVIFTDTNGKITAVEEYKSKGPKEEVYLDEDQSVTFSLNNWDANTNKIYLGIKAPTGSGTVSINGNTLNINNAVDCYYDISDYANITTDKEGIKTATFEVKATSALISVTNIKVTGNAEFTIIPGENIDVDGYEG